MNTILKIFLSMSFSGGLLILALLLGKMFWKDKISRQWQYYIWLVVVLRLLLPFGPEVSLLGRAYQAVGQVLTWPASLPPQGQSLLNAWESDFVLGVGTGADNGNGRGSMEASAAAHPFQDMGALLISHAWLVWLAAALGLLIRKITAYQGFIRYLNAGSIPVSDIGRLDMLSVVAGQAGIKRPVELCVDPLVSSPLMAGFFRPCIVLPSVDIPEKDFQYIVLHELMHYKRRDMFYKWLVQVTVCLHWFNPLVHLMGREITRACEFSCDEAVLAKLGSGKGAEYGKTLLNAMAAVGRYKGNPGAVTLGENKRLLKERLGAIMNFKKKSTAVRLLTGVLTLCVAFGAVFAGVYPVAWAAGPQGRQAPGGSPAQEKTDVNGQDSALQARRYYEAGSLPLFEVVFSRLDESAQKKWLEKLYTDGDFAFFSAAVRGLSADSPLLAGFAEKAYADGEMALFSTLTDCMEETELEFWLDRALEDGEWAFQSMLFDKLGRDGEFDEMQEKQEKEWAKDQAMEYRAAGVTADGKNYYYEGKLVNIFMDIRADSSFYVLDTNPAGSVNIKIIRDVNGEITGVAYMTEAEAAELLADME